MNATYVALGAAFIALGAAQFAQSKKQDDPARAGGKRMSGIFFFIAGAAFIVAGSLGRGSAE